MSEKLNIPFKDRFLNEIRSVYFIGIGGIGMSALARYFNSTNKKVSGYDKTKTDLTAQLENEGIRIHYKEDPKNTTDEIDLVIYTPAVPVDHSELIYYRDNGFRVVKRSDALQLITAASYNICVAGTHGKTTISTMIAHILRHSGLGCTAFLGGLSVNYNTNFWKGDNNICVVEADEYDRSFLKLMPDMAVITAMDADHLDIYGDEHTMQDAFIEFGNKIKPEGILIYKTGLSRINEITGDKISYSLEEGQSDAYAFNIHVRDGIYEFEVSLSGKIIPNFRLKIGGRHNIENALAAICVANKLNIDDESLRKAIESFRGVKRRFEFIIPPVQDYDGSSTHTVLIDDYAHHPEELKALLAGVKELFPARIVTIVFQPHLFTRTRDLANGFAEALSFADRIVLLPVYPARELPLKGIDTKIILEKIRKRDKLFFEKEEFLKWMEEVFTNPANKKEQVLVMAGAGDIDLLVPKVKQLILEKN